LLSVQPHWRIASIRNQRLERLTQGVARQVSLDPDDGMEL
jgi:type IV secretion system protein VirD4